MTSMYLDVDPGYASGSQMESFRVRAGEAAGADLPSFAALHAWATRDFRSFWRSFLQWSDLPISGDLEPVCEGDSCEHSRFFPCVRLNYAECLIRRLSEAPDSEPAIVFRDESGARQVRTRGELRLRVLAIAASLKAAGVQPGERVVALVRNSIESVEACLGAAAIGAVWSSVAPDLGIEAVLSRFRQLEPVVLFAAHALSPARARAKP